jgi:hypothetical protein
MQNKYIDPFCVLHAWMQATHQYSPVQSTEC